MTAVTFTPGMVSQFSPPEERNDLANVQSLAECHEVLKTARCEPWCPLMNGSSDQRETMRHGDLTLVAIGLRPVMKLALSIGSRGPRKEESKMGHGRERLWLSQCGV